MVLAVLQAGQGGLSENLTWGDLAAMAAVFTAVLAVLGLVGATVFRKYFAPAEVQARVEELSRHTVNRAEFDKLSNRLNAYVEASPESLKVIGEAFTTAIREVAAMGERHAADRHAELRRDLNNAFQQLRENRERVDELTESTIEIRSVVRLVFPDVAQRVLGEQFEQRRPRGGGRQTEGGG